MKNRATFKQHCSLTLAVAMGGGICSAGMSHAGDAVSGLNGKVQVMTGKVDGERANAVAGSVSMPLTHKFGAQVDALKGNNKTSGYGAHTFWRDADKGLVGVAASQVKVGDTKIQRLGIEGEYYLNNVTVSAEIGKQYGDVPKANQRRLDACHQPKREAMLLPLPPHRPLLVRGRVVEMVEVDIMEADSKLLP